ncbi:putative ribonuclease H-like domain-containing protein [Tanacetum coccineum]|uniref:Ribonuclease H-like domain-containing protein n=1 Tax=Tanacetum coccineum TaxID=301880 RepID=A0ABQ4WRN8_9ASTR
MVAINGAGFDWSYMANDEAPTNMIFMDFSDSELIGSQITDNSKRGLGYESYNAVPPPNTGRFSPPKFDLSHTGLLEFAEPSVQNYGVKPIEVVAQTSSIKISEPVKRNNDAPLIKDWESDGEDEVESPSETQRKTVEPSVDKVEADKPKKNDKPTRRSVKYAEMYKKQRPRGNQQNSNNMKSQQLGNNFVMYNKACYACGSFHHLQARCKYHQRERMVTETNHSRVNHSANTAPKAVLTRTGLKPVNSVRHVNPKRPNSAVLNAVRENKGKAVKASACWVWRPIKLDSASIVLKKHTYIDARGRSKIALYGLHQASRALYETLAKYLMGNGFQRGKIDQTLFIKRQKEDILLVQVYVDDIIFGSTKKELCTEFEELMHNRFQISSMGELTFVLGLQVKQKLDGIFISQDKYVDEILRKFKYADVKTASTPMDKVKALLKDSDGDDVDVHLYRSMIGSLMYLTSSRPDIMFDCKKQTVVATSTTEAEYVAATSCCGQCWLFITKQKCVNNQSLSHINEVGTLRYISLVVPLTKVGDEAVHKELGDRMERAATTASSFEAEQDSASIRRHLKLEDSDGINTLVNTEIFEQLALMGYVSDSDRLTFQKGHFSP